MENEMEKIEGLQRLVEFWTALADKRKMQLELARQTLEKIANYSEHAENDCCGGLAEYTLGEMKELEKWETFFEKRKGV